eukprot:1945492-Rhodomonas_salina.1
MEGSRGGRGREEVNPVWARAIRCLGGQPLVPSAGEGARDESDVVRGARWRGGRARRARMGRRDVCAITAKLGPTGLSRRVLEKRCRDRRDFVGGWERRGGESGKQRGGGIIRGWRCGWGNASGGDEVRARGFLLAVLVDGNGGEGGRGGEGEVGEACRTRTAGGREGR